VTAAAVRSSAAASAAIAAADGVLCRRRVCVSARLHQIFHDIRLVTAGRAVENYDAGNVPH